MLYVVHVIMGMYVAHECGAKILRSQSLCMPLSNLFFLKVSYLNLGNIIRGFVMFIRYQWMEHDQCVFSRPQCGLS